MLIAGCSPISTAPSTLDPWPFTEPEVVLSCAPAHVPPGVGGQAAETLRRRGARIFVSTLDGRRLAVNGAALGEAPSMRKIQATVDTRPLIAAGLRLCHDGQSGAMRLRRRNSGVPTPSSIEPPRYRVEPRRGSGHLYRADAEQIIDNKRPVLTFACSRGHAPMILIDLVRTPNAPPPLRGVYGAFQIGETSRRIEMSWATGSIWTIRSDDSRVTDAELTRAILAQGRAEFSGDGVYMPGAAVGWDMRHFDLAQMSQECA